MHHSTACEQALSDMFPDIPQQTLTTIWRNSGKDLSAAVDEALTLASLGNDNENGEMLVLYLFS